MCQDAKFHQQIVCHLPLGISCFTKFLLDWGAAAIATPISMQYQRLLLVQGVLEIPSVVNAKLMGTKKNREVLAKYLEMVQTHYTELSSDEDVIMGTFLLMKMQTP